MDGKLVEINKKLKQFDNDAAIATTTNEFGQMESIVKSQEKEIDQMLEDHNYQKLLKKDELDQKREEENNQLAEEELRKKDLRFQSYTVKKAEENKKREEERKLLDEEEARKKKDREQILD